MPHLHTCGSRARRPAACALLATSLLVAPDGAPRAQEATSLQSLPTSGESIVLDPVTITARRREEAVQDAPVSVTVVPRDDIGPGKVETLEDAAFRSPNTVFSAQGGPLTIRGVGNLGISGGVDRQPGVGMFLDEVYVARPFGYPTFLDDTERVEIVRGSQATLYGKNTIGGAVNLVFRDPGARPGAELEASFGTGPQGQLRGAFDAPFTAAFGTGDFAMRGFMAWVGGNGYIDNLPTGETVGNQNALATRFTVTGHLGPDTHLKIAVDYSHTDTDGGLWYAQMPLASGYMSNSDYVPINRVEIGGIMARLDHELGWARLTSITAYRGHEMKAVLDGDFTPADSLVQAQTEFQRQFTQDLRLASSGSGPLRWLGGLFYMYETFEGSQFFDLTSVPQAMWSSSAFSQNTNTFSAFAEVGYKVMPALELVAGLRYTFEAKDTTSSIASPSGTYMFGMPGYAAGSMDFDNFSPELSAVYTFSEGNIAFAKFARGFKSGGISPFLDVDTTANSYAPELTTSYEVGIKTTSADGRLTFNASLFYVDWQDQQAVIYTSPFTRVIRNAASATSQGVELEAAARLTENLTVSANYGYLDTRYDDFVDAVLGVVYTGNPLPFAPKNSAGAGLRWTSPVGTGQTLVAALDYSYRSSYSFNPDDLFRQGPTHLVDARVGLEAANWSATLWAKNLLDEFYLQQYFLYSGVDMGVAAQGRTFGATLKARW